VTAPLDGLRVIDLTQGDGAPFCTMQLGDAGADVVKVEPLDGDWARPLGPPFDHGDGPLFMGMNRNKRGIAVDIEHARGRAIVRDLARTADIFVQSFPKAGDAARLGLDYAALSADNPRLIYCDLSLLERQGPEADKPATDLVLQGIAGITRFVGERGKEPVRFGTNYAGITASLYATQAILAAVFWRRKSGLGQEVRTSYLRALIATQQNYLTSFSDPDVTGRGFYTAHIDPPARGYPTKDGRVEFTFSYARNPEAVGKFLESFGLTGKVSAAPHFNGRRIGAELQEELRPFIEEAFRERTNGEILQTLDELGFMCAPIHNYDSMFHDEGVLEQQMLVELQHPVRGVVKTTGLPWKLPLSPGSIRQAPPLVGEHTDEVLGELGYADELIRELRHSAVIK
jgi:crotonobetainyl-CoA:carnitine CoA-transferase CaiB-like acyl-CoA transferase